MPSFHKRRDDAPAGFFACEAAGLAWLTVAGGPRVVRTLAVTRTGLDLELLVPASPTREGAHAFGMALARLHDAGAPTFGAPPDGWTGDGFFGPLDEPLPLHAGTYQKWGEFYADCRLDQVSDQLRLRGRLDPDLACALSRTTAAVRSGAWNDDAPPARVHGDLWSGNIMWTHEGAVMIDPAAHGGHRMTDLAMLHLFGLPHLADVMAGYQSVHTLPANLDALVGLHQLYPLGMHAVLFGGRYVAHFTRSVTRYA